MEPCFKCCWICFLVFFLFFFIFYIFWDVHLSSCCSKIRWTHLSRSFFLLYSLSPPVQFYRGQRSDISGEVKEALSFGISSDPDTQINTHKHSSTVAIRCLFLFLLLYVHYSVFQVVEINHDTGSMRPHVFKLDYFLDAIWYTLF